MFSFPSNTFCQSSYANYAWGQIFQGSYITCDGKIYRFDGIEAKQTLIGEVIPEDLAHMFELAPLVAGQTFQKVHAACDFGSYTISLYPDYPDPSKTVVLSASGDWEGQLDSDAAKELCALIAKYCPPQ